MRAIAVVIALLAVLSSSVLAQDEGRSESAPWRAEKPFHALGHVPALVLFSPDDSLLAICARTSWIPRADGPFKLADNEVVLVDPARPRVVRRLGHFGETLVGAAFLSDGRLAVVSNDGRGRQTAVEVDPRSGRRSPPHLLFTPSGSARATAHGAFSADGRRFVTHYGHIEGEVIPPMRFLGRTGVYDTADWSEISSYPRDPGADDERIFLVSDGAVVIDSPREFGERHDDVRYNNAFPISQLALPYFAVGPPARPLGTVDLWGPQRSVAPSPDGRFLAACLENNSQGSLLVYDVQEGRQTEPRFRALDPTPRTRMDRLYSALAWSDHGGLLAAGFTNGVVQLWDTRTWQSVAEMSGVGQEVAVVALSHRRNILAAADRNGTLRLFRAPAPLP